MSEFHVVAQTKDLSDGEKILVETDDRLVILFQVGEDYFCLDDVCTHDGGALSDGPIVDCQIVCPRHGARFDIKSGKATCMPATQATLSHEVKVDGGDILVKINED